MRQSDNFDPDEELKTKWYNEVVVTNFLKGVEHIEGQMENVGIDTSAIDIMKWVLGPFGIPVAANPETWGRTWQPHWEQIVFEQQRKHREGDASGLNSLERLAIINSVIHGKEHPSVMSLLRQAAAIRRTGDRECPAGNESATSERIVNIESPSHQADAKATRLGNDAVKDDLSKRARAPRSTVRG